MLKTSTRLLPLLLTATLTLAACGNDAGTGLLGGATTRTPEAAVTHTIKLMRTGDFAKLAHSALPAADYTRIAAEWQRQVADDIKVSAEDRAKFVAQMAIINSPDCPTTLYALAKPKLDQYQSKYQAQLPMYLGVGQTVASTAIDRAQELDPTQKQQAKQVLAGLAAWVQGTNWGDQDKAKAALAVVCDTGRSLNLKTLDDVRKLDFDQLLTKYGHAWEGVVKVLALYGFDINAALDSAQVKTVSNDGTHAVVSTTMTLFGKPMTSESKMVQQDGHWYNEGLTKNFENAVAKLAASDAKDNSSRPTHKRVYTPGELSEMVNVGNYPEQGPPRSQVQNMDFASCVVRAEALLSAAGTNYPVKSIVNTSTLWMKKIWTNDGALVVTCSAKDSRMTLTRSDYL